MFLVELFKRLNEENVEYVVLRGYHDLPETYHHDIDFGVSNDESLGHFFNVVGQLSKQFEFKITRDEIRHGLIKIILEFGDTNLKLDIFTEYRYAGLEYINNEILHSSKRILSSGIFVPAVDSEIAISLLKEFLHNSRIREDKSATLRDQFDNKVFANPFLEYFTHETIENFRVSLFTRDNFLFLNICRKARYELLKSNIRKFGFFRVIFNVYLFFFIKYFWQSKYDKYLFGKTSK